MKHGIASEFTDENLKEIADGKGSGTDARILAAEVLKLRATDGAESFLLHENDRDFVASALHDYAKLMDRLFKEAGSCPEAQIALKSYKERAEQLSNAINPVVFFDEAHRMGSATKMIDGHRYPRRGALE